MPDEPLARYAAYLDDAHPPVDPAAIRAAAANPGDEASDLDDVRESRNQSRRPWIVAASAAAVVVLLVGIFAIGRDREVQPVVEPDPTTSGDRTGGWTALPSMPFDSSMAPLNNPTTLWTGSDLFISSTGRSPMFNLATGTWRLTSAPPIDAVTDTITLPPVWTGTEVVLFVREALGRPATRDGEVGPLVGLAYAPETDSWRRLAAVPPERSFTVVVWTGSEVLTWGNRVGVTAYDPADDTWTSLTSESGTPTPSTSVPFTPEAPGFPAATPRSATATPVSGTTCPAGSAGRRPDRPPA